MGREVTGCCQFETWRWCLFAGNMYWRCCLQEIWRDVAAYLHEGKLTLLSVCRKHDVVLPSAGNVRRLCCLFARTVTYRCGLFAGSTTWFCCLLTGNVTWRCCLFYRKRDWNGPLQKNISFVPGRHYAFEAYVKLLNDKPGKPWQTIKAVIRMTLPEKSK